MSEARREPISPRAIAASRAGFARHGLSWIDLLPFAFAAVVYFAGGRYLPLGTQVMIQIAFALSLDLILGYAGVDSLGHVAFFGMGAYGAGLFATHISSEPISGLGAAAVLGALTGLITGPLILRTRGLTLVMLTLAVATMLQQLGNASAMKPITGGADGLFGFEIAPLFGVFAFDLYGHTAYWYALGVVAFVFVVSKLVVDSPFGLAIRGIRENPVRMRMLGVSVTARLVTLYCISGALAGIAGGLSAQVTKLVGLDSLGFLLSGNALVMLILGGTGSLYGAIIGATIFVVLSDRAAAVDPFNWLFAIGFVLILAVRFAPRGVVGLIEDAARRYRARRAL
ncbi:MAG TPA: branched-chain amino acid ABC transporter permease [Stellaceae bacterium]|jgi:branched-chain amino acid transport system permease protein|nr:branched-chain amino acid ABC transporter permease [Stellaceae bacterium]